MDFSESKAERDSNIPFDSVRDTKSETDKNLNRKSGKSCLLRNPINPIIRNRTLKQSDTTKSDSGDVPFDRVTKFEKRAEKAKSKAEKAEQRFTA